MSCAFKQHPAWDNIRRPKEEVRLNKIDIKYQQLALQQHYVVNFINPIKLAVGQSFVIRSGGSLDIILLIKDSCGSFLTSGFTTLGTMSQISGELWQV